MNNELPQTLPSFDTTCYSDKENSIPCVSKPNFVDESSNIFNPPPQPPLYSCESCGSNAQYGHYCKPQALFINPEPGYSQDFNFRQNIHDFQQQYFGCDQCGGPHKNFQCQPLNYCEPNPSYDSYYSGFDQFGDFHPQQYICYENCRGPHETFQCQPTSEDYYQEQNSCYNSNSFGSDHCQPPQYIVNHPIFDAHNDLLSSRTTLMEQMTTLTSMCEMIPACCDDDDDYNSAITPVLSTEETKNSLSIGDEHLDIIPATESDEVIKSSVEDLVPILSESEEAAEIVIREVEEIEDDNLREKLLNVRLLIANIEALKDNPTPSSKLLSKSSSTSPKFFLEETNTFPPSDRSNFANEEFADELAHIISPSNLLHLAGSQPMLKSSYKAKDGGIISIPPLVGGVADVVVEIKGT
nr:hypothetical protein [Tanacetum cinerariifolium]